MEQVGEPGAGRRAVEAGRRPAHFEDGGVMSKAARSRKKSPFAPIEDAIAAIARGEMIIVVDDEDRENEGDLTIAADKITPEAINFMATHGRGLICMPMLEERLEELDIPLMVKENTARFDTAFTVSIEAKRKTSTGISAADRAATVLAAIDPMTRPADLARPGHMFPLRARTGGVLVRAGQTEAAVDLSRIAGLYPAGVICEIMNDDGTMARVPELTKFTKRHRILMITIADLIQYRMRTEALVRRVASASLPTSHGDFKVFAFESLIDRETHVALVKGELGHGENVLVRVHSRCLTGDVFHSARCDCGPQLDAAMEKIGEEGRGVLLYLNQEDGGSAWPTRSGPTSSRTRGSTPSRRTSGSGSRPTSATTESACKSCGIWGSVPCGSCPTILANSSGSRATTSQSSTGSRSRSRHRSIPGGI
jgi:3,4-dihydroxy 2-butanone 4-phosphate synthase / GTP cyclohydrolase II